MAKDKNDALAVLPKGMEGLISFEKPAGNDEGALGNEHIGKDDIIIPRLALAQKTSPETDRTHAKYVEGVSFTDMFNSITKTNYGNGPVYFSILRADKPRYVEFKPLEDGGGVIDPNVPAGDPRTKFGEFNKDTGKADKPVATQFYDYIIMVLNDLNLQDPIQNVMGLSLKSSAIKVAKQLNLLINQRGKKLLFKGVYSLTSTTDTKAGNTFAIYKVSNAGWLPPGSEVELVAGEFFDMWKDKEVIIDLEGAAHEREVASHGDQEVPNDM